MRKAILSTIALLGLAGCGHGGGGQPLTPEQVMILQGHMDRQAQINAIGAAQQTNLMSNYVNAISRIGPNRCNGWGCY